MHGSAPRESLSPVLGLGTARAKHGELWDALSLTIRPSRCLRESILGGQVPKPGCLVLAAACSTTKVAESKTASRERRMWGGGGQRRAAPPPRDNRVEWWRNR